MKTNPVASETLKTIASAVTRERTDTGARSDPPDDSMPRTCARPTAGGSSRT